MFAVYPFEFGFLKISYQSQRVTALDKLDCCDDSGSPTALTAQVYRQVCEYLQAERRQFDFPYHLHGTAFQKTVWQALCTIAYGQTRSYQQIAQAIDNPKATRAVGMANNKNPMMLVVPCHRVIGSNGALVGYAGGLAMKQRLLQLESENAARI